MVLEESNLGNNMLVENINELLSDEKLRVQLIENIQSFYHPDATMNIAAGIEKMIEEN
jgi:UDP-N-acetylglucosamine:LPS N-acetylglucosamine transferase